MPAKKKTGFTPAIEEGPYYSPGSPERTSIAEPGTPGRKLVLEGRVLGKNGNAIPHAWLDFWQADSQGQYDNRGYHLRGHQYADKNGRYRLETVRPAGYHIRAPHIHVKVRAKENATVFTTQLFFPGDKKNAADPIFNSGTVVAAEKADIVKFDIIIATE
jgi:protocatechuate 3,4-dioxygenase beta subunit